MTGALRTVLHSVGRSIGAPLLLLACAPGQPPAGPGPDDGADSDDTDETSDTDASAEPSPVRWFLHGGGPEDDDVFAPFVAAAGYGDVVTLGAATEVSDDELRWWDGYFRSLGAASAATVNATDRASAADADAIALLDDAEAIFMRGGDQSAYVAWAGTPLGDALARAAARGAVIGGSSAGCAMLGATIYDAKLGSVDPWEIAWDPHEPAVTFTANWFGGLAGVITETHLTERGRQLRLAGFLAALHEDGVTTGIGVDPRTALLVRADRTATVVGRGGVLLLRADDATRTDGAPLDIRGLRGWQLPAGYEIDLDAADPVLRRPDWVDPRAGAPAAIVLPERSVDGDARNQRQLGTWTLTGVNDPYAWVDHAIGLAPGADRVGGALLLTALYDDPDLAESLVGGALWSMANGMDGVVLGVDIGASVRLDTDGSVTPDPGSWAWVLDGRAATHLGAPTDGWQTAAVEGFDMHVVAGPLRLR